jgi:hypothetical protein
MRGEVIADGFIMVGSLVAPTVLFIPTSQMNHMCCVQGTSYIHTYIHTYMYTRATVVSMSLHAAMFSSGTFGYYKAK